MSMGGVRGAAGVLGGGDAGLLTGCGVGVVGCHEWGSYGLLGWGGKHLSIAKGIVRVRTRLSAGRPWGFD